MPPNLPPLPHRRSAIGVCSSLVRNTEVAIERVSVRSTYPPKWLLPILCEYHPRKFIPSTAPSLLRTVSSSTVVHAADTPLRDESSMETTQTTHSSPRFHTITPKSRRQHRRRQKPSLHLESSLREIGSDLYAILPRSSSIDLSFANARLPIDRKTYERHKDILSKSNNPCPITLQSILGRYIVRLHRSEPAGATSPDYSPEEAQTLLNNNYSFEDVRAWAQILLYNDSRLAAKSLVALPRPPSFLLLFTLRRRFITREGLMILLDYIKNAFKSVQDTPVRVSRLDSLPLAESAAKRHSLDGLFNHMDQLMVLIVRLLRHARETRPEALGDIIAFAIRAFERGFPGSSPDATFQNNTAVSRLTFYLNKLLALIAIPPRIHPIASARLQENAQFDLVRFMNSRNPSLTITREGYRALISVQLANPKTTDEKTWSRLKAKSWPPWKENRTGMDADITPEHGVTRAGHVIKWMEEAGYSRDDWEDIAKIYAGWDTDNSPTIQTRYISARFGVRSKFPMKKPKDERLRNLVTSRQIWAARIRATRTLREAWACFLAYEKVGLGASHNVYFAMCEKIVASSSPTPSDAEDRNEDRSLPGDGKEVFQEPSSLYEQVYVERAPPSLEDLVKELIARSVRPGGRFLELLLRHSNTIRLGVHVLNHTYPAAVGSTLLQLFTTRDPLMQSSKDMPAYLFSAYITFLCNNAKASLSAWRLVNPSGPHSFENTSAIVGTRRVFGGHHHSPIVQIVRLLLTQRPGYRMPYNIVLRRLVLGKTPSIVGKRSENSILKPLACFELMRIIIDTMENIGMDIDELAFQSMCTMMFRVRIFERSAAQQNSELELLRDRLPRYIRSLFQRLVGPRKGATPLSSTAFTDTTSTSVPPQTHAPFLIPSYHSLHCYIRALGALNDFEGLYSVACFLSDVKDELIKTVGPDRNRTRKYRMALIALRVFLEGSWVAGSTRQSDEQASEEIKLLVREKIDSLGEFGGWPTDDEVEMYCNQGSMRVLMERRAQ